MANQACGATAQLHLGRNRQPGVDRVIEPERRMATYTWDAGNLSTSLRDERLGETTAYRRNQLRAQLRVTYGNAMLTNSEHDVMDRIRRHDALTAVPRTVFEYTFDQTGRRYAGRKGDEPPGGGSLRT